MDAVRARFPVARRERRLESLRDVAFNNGS
jgi:hypothetical protein